jgi:DNA-directed RNA polymerase subunit RPC12/RpoP
MKNPLQFSDQPVEVGMTCYICGKDVEAIQFPDSEEIPCPDCSHYRISGTAVALFKQHSWRFDVDLARRWIASQQGSGVIPLIDSSRAASLI